MLNLRINRPFQIAKLSEALIDRQLSHGSRLVRLLEATLRTGHDSVYHRVHSGQAPGCQLHEVPLPVENFGPPVDKRHFLAQFKLSEDRTLEPGRDKRVCLL